MLETTGISSVLQRARERGDSDLVRDIISTLLRTQIATQIQTKASRELENLKAEREKRERVSESLGALALGSLFSGQTKTLEEALEQAKTLRGALGAVGEEAPFIRQLAALGILQLLEGRKLAEERAKREGEKRKLDWARLERQLTPEQRKEMASEQTMASLVRSVLNKLYPEQLGLYGQAQELTKEKIEKIVNAAKQIMNLMKKSELNPEDYVGKIYELDGKYYRVQPGGLIEKIELDSILKRQK